MNTQGRLPGFKYLYRTSGKDRAVVRTPGEGLLGLVGKKNEWVIDRKNPDSISQCVGEMAVHSPVWMLENGTLAEVEEELQRWQFPELYESL